MRSKSRQIRGARFLVVLSMLLALHCAPCADDVDLQDVTNARAPELSELLQETRERGHVRVIVGLRLPDPGFQPEGTLGPEAVDRQRETIASTREALLGSLSGFDVEVYAAWDSIPSVALKVDAAALAQLADVPYVTTIQEDSSDEAHRTGTASQ